jgi:hypothetical protein
MSSEELRLFDKVRVYLDEDYSSAENFTVSMNYHNVCLLNLPLCVCPCAHMHWSVSFCVLCTCCISGWK